MKWYMYDIITFIYVSVICGYVDLGQSLKIRENDSIIYIMYILFSNHHSGSKFK